MPNRDVHFPVGILATFFTVIIYLGLGHDFPEFEFIDSIFYAVATVLMGACGALVPDLIERPTNPHHRGIFHWGVGAFFTIYLIVFFVTAPSLPFLPLKYGDKMGTIIISFVAGYSSHFILDYILS